MLKEVLIPKLKATAFSLAVWLVTSSIIGGLTYFYWYPGYLFWADGGLEVMRLICCIDLILGPLLMFVVFNPKKSSRMKVADITIVLGIQIAAMVFGLYQVRSQSPAVVVFTDPEFHGVRGEMLALQGASADIYTNMGNGSRPPMLFSILPSEEQMRDVLTLLTQRHIPLYAQVQLYRPLKDNTSILFAGDAAIRKLLHAKLPAAEHRLSTEFDSSKVKLAWFVGRYDNAVLVFDPNARLLGYLNVSGDFLNPATAAPIKPTKKLNSAPG